jgi:hypothetical protein
MEVVALDPSAHQELVTLLRTMDTVTWAGDGTEAMSRFEPMYGRMVDLLASSTPLARDTTTATGTFTLSIPFADSVLVIADADLEDAPVYYSYAMLGARRNTDFELDMSRGHCRPKVVLNGTATDCEQGQVIKIPFMEVRAFDPSANRELVTLLRTMDTVTRSGDGTDRMSRIEPMYVRVLDLWARSSPIARDSTTEVGTFSLTVPSADSVLVIGHAPIEDVPVYYAYAMLKARSNTDFELDMSRGYCRRPGNILRAPRKS